jgi:riboflavin kinase/FMN adenylyltransferase
LSGIFVVEAHGLGKPWPAVANLGRRPTVNNAQARPVLEVHLFDFDGDIYRRHLQIDFLHKLRDETRFPDLAALSAQIAQDCNAARAWHAERHN